MRMNNTISVIMATYNGAMYIEKQLESIFYQTISANEVLIFDDCSIDNTLEIIRDFIIKNKIKSWELISNTRNIGWRQNFAQGIQKASGDIIFCCDQDDIWMLDKIEKMTVALNCHSKISLLASNVKTVYVTKKARKIRFNQLSLKKCALLKQTAKNYNIARPGCSFAIKKDFAMHCISKYWKPGLAHDKILWLYAYISNKLGLLNIPLLQFCRHDSNSSNDQPRSLAGRKSELLLSKKYLTQAQKMQDEIGANKNIQKVLEMQKRFIDNRQRFFVSRSILDWLKLSRFLACYSSIKSWVGDLVIVLKDAQINF